MQRENLKILIPFRSSVTSVDIPVFNWDKQDTLDCRHEGWVVVEQTKEFLYALGGGK